MADAFSQQIYDGARHWQTKLVDVSDGIGLLNLKIADVTTMTPNPGAHMKLRRVRYSIHLMTVRLMWDATTPVDLAYLSEGEDILDFSKTFAGGYPNNGGTGVTGNVLLTTVGQVAGSGFTIELEFIKGV